MSLLLSCLRSAEKGDILQINPGDNYSICDESFEKRAVESCEKSDELPQVM